MSHRIRPTFNLSNVQIPDQGMSRSDQERSLTKESAITPPFLPRVGKPKILCETSAALIADCKAVVEESKRLVAPLKIHRSRLSQTGKEL